METSIQRRGRISPGRAMPKPPRDAWVGRVLIADDDPAVRLLCAVNLRCEGLQVLEAEDGLDALDRARRERPDLVLTDVKMPGLDGFQLAQRLRGDERTRRIPLIFLTGEDGQANAERARALGALAYISKPFDPPALAAFVAHQLAIAHADSQ